MFLLNGQPLSPDRAFVHPVTGVQYPANFLRLSTLQEKEAIGITEVPDPKPYDQRFYWGYDKDGNLIPKDHAELVSLWIGNTRDTANKLLVQTDWMVVRQADNGTAMDPAWKSWRESIRLAANEKVLYIGTTNDTAELAAYITGDAYPVWPSDPDHPPVAADAAGDGVGASVDGEDAGVTTDFVGGTTSGTLTLD